MVTFVAASQAAVSTAGGTSTITVGPPASIVNGDVMIAVGCYGNQGAQTPTGWTLVDVIVSGSINCGVWWKVCASESGNYVWTINSGASKWCFGISAYRGVDNTTPIHAHTSSTTTTAANVTGPSITTTLLSHILYICSYDKTSNTAMTSTSNASLPERFDSEFNSTDGISFQVALYDDNVDTSAGTTAGTGTTCSTTPTNGLQRTIALLAAGVTQVDSAGSTDSFVRERVFTDTSGPTDSIVLEEQFNDSAGSHDSLGFIPQLDSAGSTDSIIVQLLTLNQIDSAGSTDISFNEWDKSPVDVAGSTDSMTMQRLWIDAVGNTDALNSIEHVITDSVGSVDAMQIPVIARPHIPTLRDILIAPETRNLIIPAE